MRLVHLRIMLVGAALLAATQASQAQSAYDYPWCAQYTDKVGGQACYYATLAQCMATMSGIGGNCVQNPGYRGTAHVERHPRRY